LKPQQDLLLLMLAGAAAAAVARRHEYCREWLAAAPAACVSDHLAQQTGNNYTCK
jgi:hypothetical protein